ncbi:MULTISPECIES: metallophosphoesterase [Clostridium]|uniref:Metallophosphoesterase n=1 Tax=Clostridium paridis TaxID=2803863 RepID=A0A937FGQ0_9CLOT|nr:MULTISPECIES: metallophosphoesterase [Clostridium]MBL4931116.1 metallophosphoesterase [Clostridium paridis]
MYNKRLDNLCCNSKIVELKPRDKFVFISDCHRGDGSYRDSLIQNYNIYKGALNYYLKNKFKLIEIGDGDELWENKDFRDIGFVYKDIFEILLKFKKRNDLYLIWGNHDMIKKNKKRLTKIINFSKNEAFYKVLMDLYGEGDICEGIKLTNGENEYLVIHGHQVDFFNSDLWLLSRFLLRSVWSKLQNFGIKTPISPARNISKRNKIDSRIIEWCTKNNKRIIAGHTHSSRISDLKTGEYYNDGCCVFPNHITTLEYENQRFKLIKWTLDIELDNRIVLSRKEL